MELQNELLEAIKKMIPDIVKDLQVSPKPESPYGSYRSLSGKLSLYYRVLDRMNGFASKGKPDRPMKVLVNDFMNYLQEEDPNFYELCRWHKIWRNFRVWV